ncbi:acyltransferase [Terrabacter sp. MAHUQ-38]|uniref:acyltransferase family protein n=1 Tax=unclassified Terrabacter TaxID=2630222 RepID=UPI002106C3CF|nr:acyltransferase [Terrabacter sp. MAHUQ-38]
MTTARRPPCGASSSRDATAVPQGPRPASANHSPRRPRLAYADNLKVALVAGVVLAHVFLAWNGLEGAWVLSEPTVREPLLSMLLLATVIGVSFGMPLFFMVAGLFTPGSLQHKGIRRFLRDRTIRLLAPSMAFVLLLTPPIEFVDSSNAGFRGSFWDFVPRAWWPLPPAPGPTWFLGVLLLFSVGYAVVRRYRPARREVTGRLTGRPLIGIVVVVAAASSVVRIWAPFGEERWHLALGQAPGWVAGFTLGAIAGERGWFDRLDPVLVRRVRHTAWLAMAVCAGLVAFLTTAGHNEDAFGGGGTWQSLAFALVEATVLVTVSVWAVDAFRRRAPRQGPLAGWLSRAAYATFLVHQAVLVVLILASRHLAWPTEARFVLVAVTGVTLSFAVGAVLLRVPRVGRVL